MHTAVFITSVSCLLISIAGAAPVAGGEHDHHGHSMWQRMCPRKSACCDVWRNMLHASERSFRSFISYDETKRHRDVSMFDPIEPTWNCETKQRVPEAGGDGPKWMCGIDQLGEKPLIYSFGSSGDIAFELAMRSVRPNAEIVVFDPTMAEKERNHVVTTGFKLVESGLVGRNVKEFSIGATKFPGLDLLSHMVALGHQSRVIDVLKIDIERSEYDALSTITVGDCPTADVHIGQLQIEMHVVSSNDNVIVRKFVEHLYSCGLKVFSKERNQWGCKGAYCVEFSFISPTFAFTAFNATHPSCLSGR